MCDVAPYYVVVDANIWIAERLLQSSIGSAFLYAVTGAKSAILLPEVVELEISRVLPDMAERAVGVIRPCPPRRRPHHHRNQQHPRRRLHQQQRRPFSRWRCHERRQSVGVPGRPI